MTRDEALALAKAVLGYVERPTIGVQINHRVISTIRIVRNDQITCAQTDELTLNFPTEIGSELNVTVATNVRDAAMLREAVRHAEMRATPPIRKEDEEEDDDDDPIHFALGPHTYLPVSLWHAGTQDAMATFQGDVIVRIVAAMHQSQMQCAATIALMSRAALRTYTLGMTAWGEDTDSEITVTARSADGKASGWSGQAARDWNRIRPERAVQDAITMARRTVGAMRVEPGRYTTILGPAALGGLIVKMGELFNGRVGSPFTYMNVTNNHKTKIGQRVMDERVTMRTDPADPAYGEYPFFPDNGYPSGAATWIEKGILRTLAYDPGDAQDEGKIPLKTPGAMQMSGGTTTIEEMIAQCERGIYVHRLSGVNLIDPPSAAMSGTTRDGCFLIKNGKIHSPIVNLHFYDSPVLALNRLMAIGVPERVAFGFIELKPRYGASDPMGSWPVPPIVVPPVMVRDFNFTALADAV